MECTYVRNQLIRYLDDDLPPRIRREMADHLEHCFLCAEEARELDFLERTCRESLRFPNPRDQFDRLRPHLQPKKTSGSLRRHGLRYAMMGMTAAVALIAFAELLLPFVRTTASFAALAGDSGVRRLEDPQTEQRLATAAEMREGPLVSLLARSNDIGNDDPLATYDKAAQPTPSTGANETAPAPSRPISMRQDTGRRLYLAGNEATVALRSI